MLDSTDLARMRQKQFTNMNERRTQLHRESPEKSPVQEIADDLNCRVSD